MEEKTCYFRAEMEITRFTDAMFTVTASDECDPTHEYWKDPDYNCNNIVIEENDTHRIA